VTSIRTTTPASDRMGLATRRVQLTAVWPCLARIQLPKAAANAEAELRLFVTLEGVHDALRGTVRVTAAEASGTVSASVRTLMERPVHGTFTALPHWRALELHCDGGPSIEALQPWGAGPAHESLRAYIRTNVMSMLGFDGGRYGAPRVELTEV